MAPISYRRHRFPPVVIQHAVWLYLRFTLSYRDVEELLAERGLDLSYEASQLGAQIRTGDRSRRREAVPPEPRLGMLSPCLRLIITNALCGFASSTAFAPDRWHGRDGARTSAEDRRVHQKVIRPSLSKVWFARLQMYQKTNDLVV